MWSATRRCVMAKAFTFWSLLSGIPLVGITAEASPSTVGCPTDVRRESAYVIRHRGPAARGTAGKGQLRRVRSLLVSRQVQGMRSIVLNVLVCLVVGCSGADEASLFHTALPQEVDPPLPVVLRDTTGLVSTIGPAADPHGDKIVPEVLPDPTDPKAFVITWLGGPCEGDAALSFESQGGGYLLNLAASQRGDCPAIGYPRGVRIVTTVAIPISLIEVTGRG
jgi:hypothetical protein